MLLKPALVLTAALSFLSPPVVASIGSQEELTRVADAFYDNLAIDESNIYEVKNVTIKKDIATFNLTSGTLYFTKPLEGMVAAAVFTGEGTASIAPSRPMDKRCLDLAGEQHLKKKPGGKLQTGFDQMLLIGFDDTLGDMLKSSSVKGVATSAPLAAGILKNRLEVLKVQEVGFDITLAENVAGLGEAPLYFDFRSADYDWLVFAYLPRQQFEVFLGTREKIGMFYDTHPLIRTHRTADFDAAGNYVADPVADEKSLIDVKSYRMEITIPNTEHILVEADVTFSPLVDHLPIVEFDLVNNIAGAKTTEKWKPIYLNKVTDGSGKELPFLHRKNTVLVVPTEPLKAGSDHTLHFSLDEQTIIQISSVHYQVLNTYAWFPQHGYNGGQYTMDWTVRARKPLVATGSGRVLKEGPEGVYNVTHLRFEKEVQFPSLIFGEYQKLADAYKDPENGTDVALAVFSSPSATYTITDSDVVRLLTQGRQSSPLPFQLVVPAGKPRSVIDEAKGIIKFCENLYGPFPYDTLHVAQMAPFQGFGQSPPGFVQLTGDAFMNPAAEVRFGDYYLDFSALKLDFFHEFFAHEIAHQWFGHSIVWATHEDVWLSEAFAEYTAGLYVMQYMGQDRFQGKLKEWRDAARSADPYAPIAWAANLSGPAPGPQATRLIYSKGPYVVHMLRMQIGHDNFVKAMKNTILKYRHKPITTDHLRQEVEAVAGYKLDYFFDQWFRDSGIPTFDYSTSVEPAPDGKWLATVKISQRDKQNFKIVSMPVFLHFGKDKVIMKQRPILNADDVYQIKLPEKPEKITLDDYKTLLADIVAQGASAS